MTTVLGDATQLTQQLDALKAVDTSSMSQDELKSHNAQLQSLNTQVANANSNSNASSGEKSKKEGSLKISISLDLDVEVHLTARIKGDIVIGLL